MQPNPQLVDELYRDRVRRARAMTAEEKFVAGPDLFEYACEITLAGIREQHPHSDETEVRRILADRLALRRKLEEHGIYRPTGESP